MVVAPNADVPIPYGGSRCGLVTWISTCVNHSRVRMNRLVKSCCRGGVSRTGERCDSVARMACAPGGANLFCDLDPHAGDLPIEVERYPHLRTSILTANGRLICDCCHTRVQWAPVP